MGQQKKIQLIWEWTRRFSPGGRREEREEKERELTSGSLSDEIILLAPPYLQM